MIAHQAVARTAFRSASRTRPRPRSAPGWYPRTSAAPVRVGRRVAQGHAVSLPGCHGQERGLGGGAMQLAYAHDSLRLLCETEALLFRDWGELWMSVAVCLSVLAFADTLAEFATLATVTIRRASQPASGVEFVIDHDAFEMRLRAIDHAGRCLRLPDDDRDAFRLVRAVSVLSLKRVAKAVRA